MTTNPSVMLSVEEEKKILARISDPLFPARDVNVRDCGAVGDGTTLDTDAIQRAIRKAHALGGGRVVIPSGRFLTGSLELLSHVNLYLENRDSVLLFTTDTSEAHYPLAFGHWECSPLWNYRALIYAHRADNIALTGSGVLDGQASESVWWHWTHQIEHAWSTHAQNLQRAGSLRLREMNQSGVPVAERRFGDGFYLRPMFIQTLHCQNVLLEGGDAAQFTDVASEPGDVSQCYRSAHDAAFPRP
ncbi:Exo-poly-alpha-D-galacturonosidase precursor [Kluyvera intermedia]|nr:glycosyl hydrolase family 28-related protein [Kluyvera intermedia]VDZ84968.1 Exo-poly-alpha-D-galacturonosidase precursor [Kluyvera intermedia]